MVEILDVKASVLKLSVKYTLRRPTFRLKFLKH